MTTVDGERHFGGSLAEFPFTDTKVYIALTALLLNIIVAVVLTLVFRAMQTAGRHRRPPTPDDYYADSGVDLPMAGEYLGDEGDPRPRQDLAAAPRNRSPAAVKHTTLPMCVRLLGRSRGRDRAPNSSAKRGNHPGLSGLVCSESPHHRRRSGRVEMSEEAGMVDRPALDELYSASYRRLVVQLYAICGDLSDAEDAVQEGFVAALRKHRQMAKVQNPEAWVRTTALHHLHSRWRHAAVVRKYQPRVPGPAAADRDRARARRDRDRAGTGRLRSARGGRAPLLGRSGDRRNRRTSSAFPEGTVKSRLARARERLAGLLG